MNPVPLSPIEGDVSPDAVTFTARPLTTIEPGARDAFLSRLIDVWEHRYATWR